MWVLNILPSRTLIGSLRFDWVIAILACCLWTMVNSVWRGMLEKRVKSRSKGSQEEEDKFHIHISALEIQSWPADCNSDGIQLLNIKYEINVMKLSRVKHALNYSTLHREECCVSLTSAQQQTLCA